MHSPIVRGHFSQLVWKRTYVVMACAANAYQIDAVIQTTIDGSQVPDGAAGTNGRRMQRKSYSRETKLELVSFHHENGENLNKTSKRFSLNDHSACHGRYMPLGVPLASLPQLESMFPCKYGDHVQPSPTQTVSPSHASTSARHLCM